MAFKFRKKQTNKSDHSFIHCAVAVGGCWPAVEHPDSCLLTPAMGWGERMGSTTARKLMGWDNDQLISEGESREKQVFQRQILTTSCQQTNTKPVCKHLLLWKDLSFLRYFPFPQKACLGAALNQKWRENLVLNPESSFSSLDWDQQNA